VVAVAWDMARGRIPVVDMEAADKEEVADKEMVVRVGNKGAVLELRKFPHLDLKYLPIHHHPLH
jgi:hypothetical protein